MADKRRDSRYHVGIIRAISRRKSYVSLLERSEYRVVKTAALYREHARGCSSMTAGDYLQRVWLYFTIPILVIILLGASVFVVETLPPRTIVMATGAEGGANHEMGIRYREILLQAGVKLQLLPTAGSLENLALLRNSQSGVSVAFIQGGTTSKKESSDLETLGTVFYEPLWLFYRSEIGEGMQALRGRRLSIGPEGSGGRALALDLVKRTKVDSIIGELLGFTPQLAAEKLIAGDIDAAFIVTAWDSPVVQHLITAKGIELASFLRADAYTALYPFLNKLVLPAGVVDFLMNRPPADVVLLAPKASLAVRANLHPAIQHLLLSAAVQIHSQPGIFQKSGQSGSRVHRRSAEQRSAAFLQDWATIPGRTSSVLDCDASRKDSCRFRAFGSLVVPHVKIPATNLRLAHALKNNAPIR